MDQRGLGTDTFHRTVFDNERVTDLRPHLPSPLQEVSDDRFARHGVRLLLKRDDLIHPELIGNKWRKLAPNLERAAGRTLLTFGGAYSNHLRATAAAGRLLGLPTVGVVRGDELAGRPLNPSLARCVADGMRLHFVDRSTYRRKTEPDVLGTLLGAVGAQDAYVVPEGGSNAAAVRGCRALGEELRGRTDVVALACGTGGTLAGLAAGLAPAQRALGIPVLKGASWRAGYRHSRRRPSAAGGASGGSTSASTSADTPVSLPRSSPSRRTSSCATACPWNVSMSPSRSTVLSPSPRRVPSRGERP